MSQTPLQDPIHFPQSLVLKLHLFSTEAHFLSDFIPPTWLSMSFSCYLTGWAREVLQRALHLPFLCPAGKKLTSLISQATPQDFLSASFKISIRGLPAGPVAKTPCPQCRGSGFDFLVRKLDPTCRNCDPAQSNK